MAPRRAAASRPPNMLITGTPGTGKTTLAEAVAAAAGLAHVDVGKAIREQELHSGWDEEFQCHIVDEDKVCDALETQMSAGGNVVDYHSCGFFPERWFDLVVVLQTNNTVLYERLEKRGYSAKKITENIDCEIFGVVLEEAQESYAEGAVRPLCSNTVEDMEANVETLRAWLAERGAGAPA